MMNTRTLSRTLGVTVGFLADFWLIRVLWDQLSTPLLIIFVYRMDPRSFGIHPEAFIMPSLLFILSVLGLIAMVCNTLSDWENNPPTHPVTLGENQL